MVRQQERAQEKLKECTFQPNACNESKKTQTRAKENCNALNYEDFVHNRLHDDAHRRNAERHAIDADNQPIDVQFDCSTRQRSQPKTKPNNSQATSRSTTPRRGRVVEDGPRAQWSSLAAQSSLAAPSKAPVSFEAFMRSIAT